MYFTPDEFTPVAPAGEQNAPGEISDCEALGVGVGVGVALGVALGVGVADGAGEEGSGVGATQFVVTVEEHSVGRGLGSLVGVGTGSIVGFTSGVGATALRWYLYPGSTATFISPMLQLWK